MISIVTPRYVKSEWCTKEVNLFYKAASTTGGISVDNKSRIFKIVKTPVQLDEQPEIMRPLLGYDFFRVDPQTKRPREFGVHGKEKEIEIQYWTKLDDVAYDVAQLISKLSREEIKTVQQPQSFSAGTGMLTLPVENEQKIYLAETSYDLEEYRDNLKRELENKGFKVLPDKNIKPIASVYRKEVSEMMNECVLSLHLIGSSYGLVPDGEDKSNLAIQNEIASEQSASRGLNRLLWVPEINTAEDQRLIDFIDQLKHKEDLQTGSDLLHGTIEEFKFAIFDTLKEIDKAAKAKEALTNKVAPQAIGLMGSNITSQPEVKTIYLVCDQRDLELVAPIDDYLYDSGFNVWKTVFDGTQEELTEAHQDSLRDCDAVLIYYGNANEAWLRAKISELKRKPAYPGAKPLLFSMVYIGNPSNPSKVSYRSRDVNLVVNGLDGFQAEKLNDLVQKLK